MKEVVILDADGRPAKGMQLDRFGNAEAFRKFCEKRTGCAPDDREETGKVRLFVR